MRKSIKRTVKLIFVLVGMILIGYGVYKGYNYVVENITRRIKQGVAEGVGKGVIGVINPLSWPGKLVGGVKI